MPQSDILAVSARAPSVRGASKRFKYWSFGVYRAEPRVFGGGWYWVLVHMGPSHRSKALRDKDMEKLSKERKAPILSWNESLNGKDATDHVMELRGAQMNREDKLRWLERKRKLLPREELLVLAAKFNILADLIGVGDDDEGR